MNVSGLSELNSGSITRTVIQEADEISLGSIVSGKYRIIKELGRGGMGIVYKAQDQRLKRNVAIKFLHPESVREQEARQRFIQEAQAAAALDHPNICSVYEVSEASDQSFIIMSYIKGFSLKERLKSGPLNIDQALKIATQVAEGLKEAHEKGIVHRDVKPANIMLTDKGQAKIMDFGLAKLSWGADLTRASIIMGTVAYMSPEQSRGEETDHRTDIWSLGCVLYEMLCGNRPFKGQHDQAIIYSILNEEPQPLTALHTKVSKTLKQVVFRALEKKISRRYQNLDEFILDLQRAPEFPHLHPERKMSNPVIPNEVVNAYEYFIKARQGIFLYTEDGLDRALHHLQNGLNIIGEDAILYGGLGYVYFQYASLGINPEKQELYIHQAEEYAKKALQLDTKSAQGYFLLGLLNQVFRANQHRGAVLLKQALANDPNDFDAMYWLSQCYAYVGKIYAAIPLVKKMLEIDSSHPLSQGIQAALYFYEGRFNLVQDQMSKIYNKSPKTSMGNFWYALCLAYNNRRRECFAVINRSLKTATEGIWQQLSLCLKFALQGQKNKIKLLMKEKLHALAHRDCQVACFISIFYAMMKDHTNALEWMEIAADRGFVNYPFISVSDPFLENIRIGVRYRKLLERIKQEWENFKV